MIRTKGVNPNRNGHLGRHRRKSENSVNVNLTEKGWRFGDQTGTRKGSCEQGNEFSYFMQQGGFPLLDERTFDSKDSFPRVN
jgi:hypothetical protein